MTFDRVITDFQAWKWSRQSRGGGRRQHQIKVKKLPVAFAALDVIYKREQRECPNSNR